MLCKRLHSERHEPPHALKSSQRGRMISDFRVQELDSKLTIQATKWDEKIQIPKLEVRGENEKVTQCLRQGSEGHNPPHALKSSQRGRMISDFRVPELESNLTIQAMTWDEKNQIPKLELRGVNEKVTQCQRQGSEGHDPPHALKSSYRGRMISDFRVSNLESKLTRQATTWDKKIQIPKLELRGVNEKVR